MLSEPAAFPRTAPSGDTNRRAAPAARAADLAAEAWGAARTWFLPHGTTQGNLAACLALRSVRGRQVVVQRDVQPSVVSGLIAAGLAPHWLAPELDAIAGVAHGVTPAALDAALGEAPGARAAIVVAPAYHGAMPDVEALTAVAHCHGAALVVDEAHGGHLPFHPALPAHAIAAGADLAVSGAGMLHLGPWAERWLPEAAIERAMRLCEPAPAGAPAPAALHAAGHGQRHLDATLRSLAAARAQLTGVPGVRVLGPELAGAPGVDAFDPLRLTVDLHDSGRDARAVATLLRERAGIECDLETGRLLVVVPGTGGDEPALAERFAATLLETLWTVPPGERPVASLPPVRPGPAICTPRAAWLSPQERVPAEAAIGRIAAETLSPYPPGVPAVLPGERLEPEVVATLCAIAAAGGVVRGSEDGLGTFGVVAGSAGGASRPGAAWAPARGRSRRPRSGRSRPSRSA